MEGIVPQFGGKDKMEYLRGYKSEFVFLFFQSKSFD